MLSEKGGRKAGEVSDVAFVKSKLEGRESRGEEGGVGKCNKFGRRGGADGNMSGFGGRRGRCWGW